MGKTAVFVLSTLQLLDLSSTAERKGPLVLVLAHTRELAFQIHKEYQRFSKNFPDFKCEVIYGGVPINKNVEALAANPVCSLLCEPFF
jgi:ATP-dependent RNA helicase UAP56/SUB2